MKKGKLTTIEKMAIEGMFNKGIEIEEIATELDRSKNAVKKYLTTVEIKDAEKIDEKTTAKNKAMFVRRTAGKNDKGVSIMTEGEAARSELSAKTNQSTLKKRFRSTTHIISPDEDG